ncbi:MAG: Fe-S cluster assembly protein SufD [Acidimicrobiia bacterium]
MTAFDPDSLARLSAGAPSWRGDAMEAAYRVFESMEEPSGAEDDWRYVDYDMPFSGLEPVGEPGPMLPAGPFVSALPEVSGRVAIVDGTVVAAASEGAEVQALSGIEAERYTTRVPTDHNKLAAAHSAFAHDGVFVDFAPGSVTAAPLLIEVQATAAGTASFPHVSVHVGENAEARVVVIYRSAAGVELLMVPEIDLEVGNGANLRFLSVQNLDHAASCVVHQRMRLGRDATGRLGEVGLGSSFGRLDLAVDLEGDGCSAETVGLYFGEGSQILDYRMMIRHSGRNTSSDVFLKGAVEDAAESVFTGLLRIEKAAVRTSTFETNRNLVLSENAKANSIPKLEILCDDVICGHASSVGPLEEENLYYLQSRGLTRPRAERLLIKGFFQEVVDRLPIQGLGEPISDEVFRRFVTAQIEGRVA